MSPQKRRLIQVGPQPVSLQPVSLAPDTVPAQTLQRPPSALERRRRREPRPGELLQAVRNLDLTQDAAYRAELTEWIEDAYTERMGGVLLGLFARCHLGPPYVDHRLTVVGHILEHYRPTDIVPPPFDAARTLAQSPVYEYVEVYSDGDIIPVLADGSVS
ncbi:hypothetical protein [Actinomyces sp. HMT897]|uniref:hypothetical protein n=1 Tax=Actinomyces sp. HMT897 TaxID=2789424 RepID=UPI00190D51F0|nr:hypothetical protein [Actinomyces sp. HMT897]QQO78602.1 hypothetical protein JJJ15_04665 [Actinomyces sp. HMT897]